MSKCTLGSSTFSKYFLKQQYILRVTYYRVTSRIHIIHASILPHLSRASQVRTVVFKPPINRSPKDKKCCCTNYAVRTVYHITCLLHEVHWYDIFVFNLIYGFSSLCRYFCCKFKFARDTAVERSCHSVSPLTLC